MSIHAYADEGFPVHVTDASPARVLFHDIIIYKNTCVDEASVTLGCPHKHACMDI